jgi:peptidyl-prolyl cis-trans isomerase SurA
MRATCLSPVAIDPERKFDTIQRNTSATFLGSNAIGSMVIAKKIMPTISYLPLLFLVTSCILTTIPEAVSSVRAQTGIVMDNGEPVTEDDIEQRSKLDLLTTHTESARQDVINELIGEKKRIREAEKYGVSPTNAEIDGTFTEMCSRMRITPEQLTKSLEGRGIRPDALKQRIKAEIARRTLIRLCRSEVASNALCTF